MVRTPQMLAQLTLATGSDQPLRRDGDQRRSWCSDSGWLPHQNTWNVRSNWNEKPALMVIIREYGQRRVRAGWVPNTFTVKHITARKTSVQNFSSAVRTKGMLFCQEQLPVMKPEFIISTHGRKDYQWNGIITQQKISRCRLLRVESRLASSGAEKVS
jgi:hypothetical protein